MGKSYGVAKQNFNISVDINDAVEIILGEVEKLIDEAINMQVNEYELDQEDFDSDDMRATYSGCYKTRYSYEHIKATRYDPPEDILELGIEGLDHKEIVDYVNNKLPDILKGIIDIQIDEDEENRDYIPDEHDKDY